MFPSYFSKGHALIDSLPRLTPPPGLTPTGVTIAAIFNEAEQKVEITWPASPDDDIEDYIVSCVPGATWSNEDDTPIDTIPAGPGPFRFLTDAGVTNPGDQATYKVITRNSTGNVKASNAVTIQRPTPPPPP